ncbi:MAG: hypothetical protein JWM85_1129 [Acidimicrobiaceae bacterium]|nr:hypothetical protein [Acidimicrobiaceae bacterium]
MLFTFVAGVLIAGLLDAATSSQAAAQRAGGVFGLAGSFMNRLVDPTIPAVGSSPSKSGSGSGGGSGGSGSSLNVLVPGWSIFNDIGQGLGKPPPSTSITGAGSQSATHLGVPVKDNPTTGQFPHPGR